MKSKYSEKSFKSDPEVSKYVDVGEYPISVQLEPEYKEMSDNPKPKPSKYVPVEYQIPSRPKYPELPDDFGSEYRKYETEPQKPNEQRSEAKNDRPSLNSFSFESLIETPKSDPTPLTPAPMVTKRRDSYDASAYVIDQRPKANTRLSNDQKIESWIEAPESDPAPVTPVLPVATKRRDNYAYEYVDYQDQESKSKINTPLSNSNSFVYDEKLEPFIEAPEPEPIQTTPVAVVAKRRDSNAYAYADEYRRQAQIQPVYQEYSEYLYPVNGERRYDTYTYKDTIGATLYSTSPPKKQASQQDSKKNEEGSRDAVEIFNQQDSKKNEEGSRDAVEIFNQQDSKKNEEGSRDAVEIFNSDEHYPENPTDSDKDGETKESIKRETGRGGEKMDNYPVKMQGKLKQKHKNCTKKKNQGRVNSKA